MRTFQDLYPTSYLIFDGGVATELYERGFYINRPFEELNLTNPGDVGAVHESYLEAGAMMVTTNSFSLTAPQLEKFDILNRQEELIQAAVRIARHSVERFLKKPENTHKKVGVGFSIGPLGALIEPLGRISFDEVRAEYEKIGRFVHASSFDFYILETFSNLDELACAVDGIRRVDSVRPVLASITAVSTQSTFIQEFARKFESRNDVQALGMNCSEGPHDLLQSLKTLSASTQKLIIIQPNAGIPRNINGRYFYMTSPDYLAKYARRFIEAGAYGVGGCCGTGPDHIRAIAQAVKMMEAKGLGSKSVGSGQALNPGNAEETGLSIEFIEKVKSPVQGLSKASEKNSHSKILQKLAQKKKVISIELTSPRGTDISKLLAAIEKVKNAKVDFVNIPDGARATTRVSSLHLAAFINSQQNLGVTVIPHLTTRDRNLIALQSDLLGASINHVHDLLLVTGDPPKLGNSREATAVYDIDSIGLTYLVNRLNQGLTPNGESMGSQTQFGIGVAANPTAINLELELKRWQYKVESGADFAVTQPIYEAQTFLQWKDKISPQYRPHIVGIWPFVSFKNAEFMAHEVPGVFVPQWALEKMSTVQDDPKKSVQTGIQIAAQLMKELWDDCEGFAISAPLGRVEVALEVLQCLQ